MELPLLTFALMTFVVVMTPGPTVLLALSNGSRLGIGPASFGIMGAALSDIALITAAALGLGALLSASAVLFTIVKAVGVSYLLWIGVQMIRSSGGTGSRTPASPLSSEVGAAALFRKSFLVAATNPKGYLFFTAFLPQFLIVAQPMVSQYIKLAFVFVTIDVLVMAAYAGLGAKATQHLSPGIRRWMDQTCGSFLIALGCALAFVRRNEV